MRQPTYQLGHCQREGLCGGAGVVRRRDSERVGAGGSGVPLSVAVPFPLLVHVNPATVPERVSVGVG